MKIQQEIDSKLVICHITSFESISFWIFTVSFFLFICHMCNYSVIVSFVTCAVLSLLFSRSALNSEHARTCSLTLFSDATHIHNLVMTSKDIILSWTLRLGITHTKNFRFYGHMTWRHMTSCLSANHESDWVSLVDETSKFNMKADQNFNSQSSFFGGIQIW